MEDKKHLGVHNLAETDRNQLSQKEARIDLVVVEGRIWAKPSLLINPHNELDSQKSRLGSDLFVSSGTS